MADWEVKKLSEVAEIIGGGTPSSSKSEYFENGDIAWLTPKDLSGYYNRYISKGERNITKLGLDNSSAKLLPAGSVLLTSRAPIGYVAIAKNPISTNQGFKNLVLKEGHIPEFYYYLLKNNISLLESRATGSTFKEISGQILKDTELNIPTIEIQKKIVDILNPLDEKIELNTQTNQTLEAIAQAIFKSWFVDFDPVRAKAAALSEGKSEHEANLAAMSVICGKDTSELNDTEYKALWQIAEAFPSELVENEQFGEVPKGWEIMKIEDIINKISTGKKYSQKTIEETGKVPVLDQGRSGLIGFHNDEAGVKASIEDPVIVFANHTCYMRLISYDFSAIQNVFAFKGNNCNIYWLYLATLGKQKFTEYKGHFPDFLIKQIIIPNVELTKLFGDFVKPQFISIFENDKQIKILSEVRDLLLPKLLSGEI